MKAYYSILRLRYLLLTQYRLAAFAGICTQFLFGFVRVMIFDRFYQSSTLTQPMSYQQTVTYIWIGQALLGMLPWNGDGEIQSMIKTGNLAYELSRPLDLYNHWFMRAIALRSAPTLLRSIPLFILTLCLLPSPYRMLLPASSFTLGVWIISTFFALLLASALTNLLNISMLWTLSGEGIIRLVPAVILIFSGMIIPLPLFPDWMQPLLRILPFSGLVDTPIRIYLGHFPSAQYLSLFVHQIVWLLLFIALGHYLLARGLKRTVIQGGYMADIIRLYAHYVSISLRSQLEYKASFIFLSLGNLLVTVIDFFGIWTLFARFDTIIGWTLPEVALFYGIVHIAFVLSEAGVRGFDILHRLVRSGDFDRLLLRPRSTAFQVIGQEVQLMRIGRFVQGSVVLAWALVTLGIGDVGSFLLIFASILGGACLFSGLFVLQATLSFWSVDSLEFTNMFTYGGVETAQFPLSIYAPGFRRIFIYIIPLATINYFPAIKILAKTDPLHSPGWIQTISPLVGLVFFLVCLQIWEFGVKHYTSTGS